MVNTLVTHKKFTELGIGCISKELSKSYKVNFGKYDVKTCKKDALVIVDTSNCKTITYREFRDRIMLKDSKLNNVILGNEVLEYVGIGWVTIGIVNLSDLNKYPRVVM